MAAHARGLEAFGRKDFPAAVRDLREAVRQQPKNALLHMQLGAALRATGDIAAAIETYNLALASPVDESLPLIHNNLGNALRDTGDLQTSLRHLKEAVRIKPDYPEAQYNLALTLLRLDQLGDAEQACDKATSLRPDYGEALVLAGQLAGLRGAFDRAVDSIRAAVVLMPKSVDYRLALASALQAMGRFDEADTEVEAAARLAPTNHEATFAVARQREQRGDRDGAAEMYRRVFRAVPSHGSACLSLATGSGLDDEELDIAEQMAASTELRADERAAFGYALARSYDRLKDHDRAFAWARFANGLESARTSFSESETAAFVERSIATFTRDSFDTGPTGSADDRPVFIVGFPRSGTSLVEQIIASHPRAAPGGELVEIPDIVSDLPDPYPDCVAALTQQDTDRLVNRYRQRLETISPTAQRITDKLPFNFRNLGLIARLFPATRVIYCRRQPLDIALSCYFIRFHRPISFAQNLSDFGAYWRLHEELVKHWKRVLPVPILQVDYEDVVDDPDGQIRRLIDFVDLPWDERCLRFYETDSIVRTASVNQIRNPIYSGSVGRWRPYAKHLSQLLYALDKEASID
ncbi:MAG: tetratricopeptide repeat protein [Hyphomicrobiales bacterium]|nr:tetratricopeptide repeat protein [Hyphomicrobiales bacterium]